MSASESLKVRSARARCCAPAPSSVGADAQRGKTNGRGLGHSVPLRPFPLSPTPLRWRKSPSRRLSPL
eukprot:scaffold1421_cov255-Pinguiococcus_pyrenoidosus.AAC.16